MSYYVNKLTRKYGTLDKAQKAFDAWVNAGYTEVEAYTNALEFKNPPPAKASRVDKKKDKSDR